MNHEKLFVKHLPSQKLDPDKYTLLTTAADIQVETNDCHAGLSTITRDDQFDKSNNPVHAIESIILCHDAGLYPPLNVMHWLVDSLKDWHNNNGHKSMDQAMGLKNSGWNAMREAIKEQLYEDIMIEHFRIKNMFEITYKDAAEIVISRLEDTKWNFSGYEIPPISVETLLDKRKKKWAKILNDTEYKEIAETFKNIPPSEKIEILSHYPLHSYSHITKMEQYIK